MPRHSSRVSAVRPKPAQTSFTAAITASLSSNRVPFQSHTICLAPSAFPRLLTMPTLGNDPGVSQGELAWWTQDIRHTTHHLGPFRNRVPGSLPPPSWLVQ